MRKMISLGDALKESMNRRCTFFGLTFRTGTKKNLGPYLVFLWTEMEAWKANE